MTLAASPRHPLHFANFRAYLVGRLCAVLAQYSMMIVLAWQAYNIARETMTTGAASAQLGLIGLAQFLPLFFLTPVTGWVADHYDRRVITRLTLTLLTIAAGLLAFATYEGWVSLPLIFGIAVIVGIARAFNGPAYGALAPNLVPPAVLPNAIAISSVVWQAGMIAGPAVGGYAFAATPWGAYALAAILYAVALGAMLMIGPVPQPPRDTTRHPIRQMIDGFTYVKGNRLVLATITLDLFAVLLAGATALLPVYARDILHVGARGLGHLAAAPGIGAGLTALWFSFRPMKTEVGLKMLGSVILFGLATIAFGCTAFLPRDIAIEAGIASLVVLGGADMVSVFVRQSLVQLHTPDAMRGRVSSLSQLTISASNELGEAESGFLAALVGPVAAVIGGGVGAIVITLFWARLFPELRLARSFDPPDIGRDENKLVGDPV
ncbi:MFS transporter [Sphingobium sp. CR2-8]|uniref:MFS transporter n=1 Tax=Sphingobium sp. CR2-8 TaxID=1306534 RepID=UPI002DBF39DC|nr:MFS transporter [Sphingobium sp. CR2-8]MEC3910335.1 MFS transporter [Sphingobium sp. CR2-8]